MGAVVGCLGLSTHYLKKLREKKKGESSKTQETAATPGASQSRARVEASQPLSPFPASQGGAQSEPVKDAQQGLQDKYLATVPPTVEPGGEHRSATEAIGTKEVTRDVATAAPLPTV
jgi:hypothetical protein